MKAGYEQRSNETHLGVGETDLATVNTFASVERVSEAGWMNLRFSVFLTNLVSAKAIVVTVQQNSCTRRIFAYSQPQRDIRSAGWVERTWVGTAAVSWILLALVLFTSVVFASVLFARVDLRIGVAVLFPLPPGT